MLRDTRSQEGLAQGHLEAHGECWAGICYRVGEVIKGYPWDWTVQEHGKGEQSGCRPQKTSWRGNSEVTEAQGSGDAGARGAGS